MYVPVKHCEKEDGVNVSKQVNKRFTTATVTFLTCIDICVIHLIVYLFVCLLNVKF